jgi:hypothetical protein
VFGGRTRPGFMYFLSTGGRRLPFGAALFVDEEEWCCLALGEAGPGPPRDRPDIMLVSGWAMMRCLRGGDSVVHDKQGFGADAGC